jgi:hypothetical protein
MTLTPEQLTAIIAGMVILARFLEYIGKSLYFLVIGKKDKKDCGLYTDVEEKDIARALGLSVKNENDIKEVKENHSLHQKAIEEWMKKMNAVMVKVATKLGINTDEFLR